MWSASYLWQQLELASELESDLRGNVEWGRKWLVNFNSGTTQLVLFNWSNNTGAIDVNMDGYVHEGKSSFKMQELTFSSKLDWDSYIISTAKTASKKIGVLIRFVKFLLCSFINQQYDLVWNAFAMTRLVLLVATWNCWISYKNGYAGLLALHLLPPLKHWLIVKV